MRKVIFDHPHRTKHFDFFQNLNHPHFNITAPVEVEGLIRTCKDKKISIHLALVYLVSKVANEIKEFRWRIRDKEIVEHDIVHPSFTVDTDSADVFSFCEVKYDHRSDVFIKRAASAQNERTAKPYLEDEPGRDDYLFLSSFPWVAFTGYQHAMQFHPHDSVPRISWGKIHHAHQKLVMPLSVQVHHAIVDRRHVGQYFEMIQAYASRHDFL